MYVVVDIRGSKVSVLDTTDGVVERFPYDILASSGLRIFGLADYKGFRYRISVASNKKAYNLVLLKLDDNIYFDEFDIFVENGHPDYTVLSKWVRLDDITKDSAVIGLRVKLESMILNESNQLMKLLLDVLTIYSFKRYNGQLSVDLNGNIFDVHRDRSDFLLEFLKYIYRGEPTLGVNINGYKLLGIQQSNIIIKRYKDFVLFIDDSIVIKVKKKYMDINRTYESARLGLAYGDVSCDEFGTLLVGCNRVFRLDLGDNFCVRFASGVVSIGTLVINGKLSSFSSEAYTVINVERIIFGENCDKICNLIRFLKYIYSCSYVEGSKAVIQELLKEDLLLQYSVGIQIKINDIYSKTDFLKFINNASKLSIDVKNSIRRGSECFYE